MSGNSYDKQHKVSNSYGHLKIHKSMITESTINIQNSEIIEIFEPTDLRLKPIVGGPKYPTRKLSQLTDILLKYFLKHIKSLPKTHQKLCFREFVFFN